MRKLKASFIIPATNKEIVQKFRKNLSLRFSEFQVIPIYKGKSIWDAWEKGIQKAKYEILILSHQDVTFWYFPDLKTELEGGVELLGVVGTEYLSNKSPYWFSETKLKQGLLSGQCYHIFDGTEVLSYYGPYREVVGVDGVCMVIKKQTIKKINFKKYSKWTSWEWYDQILSYEAGKLGKVVTVPIQLTHHSLGNRWNKLNDSIADFNRSMAEELGENWELKV